MSTRRLGLFTRLLPDRPDASALRLYSQAREQFSCSATALGRTSLPDLNVPSTAKLRRDRELRGDCDLSAVSAR